MSQRKIRLSRPHIHLVNFCYFLLFSYEEDPDLFMFDYREDLFTRAVERERVFTLNKFVEPEDQDAATQEKKHQQKIAKKLLKETDKDFFDADNVGETDFKPNGTGASGKGGVASDDQSSDDDYIPKPERTSYPEMDGIKNKFGAM